MRGLPSVETLGLDMPALRAWIQCRKLDQSWKSGRSRGRAARHLL